MKKLYVNIYICVYVLLISTYSYAQTLPEKPNRLVNDYAHLLSADEVQSLEQKLVAYNDSTSTQIAIAIIETLDGNERADYTIKLANKWGIGQQGKRNGILIMVAKQERKLFIATGYGVESNLPDAIIKRIEQKYMLPQFKAGNYYQGLNDGIDVMQQALAGEYKAEQHDDGKPSDTMTFIFILLIIFVVILLMKRGNNGGNGRGGLLNNPALAFIGWGNFSSGGSNWGGGNFGGGGSSGGFGGFGGGSFGGGGAGGDW
jgi:uncharacterized protein